MDTRAAKRQRRLTVISSDDELDTPIKNKKLESSNLYEHATPVPCTKSNTKKSSNSRDEPNSKALPLLSSRSRTASSQASAGHKAYSSSSSPDKRKHGNGPTNKSLHNFFQPASEEQRWSSRQSERQQASVPVAEKVDDESDMIEDDYDSYDELFTQHFTDDKIIEPNPAKSQAVKQNLPNEPPPKKTGHTRPTKRFLLSTDSISSKSNQSFSVPSAEDDKRPWAQRYAPLNLEELAVHKRKVADVQNWLTSVFSGGNDSRLLVLRGPAGSGKTTTVSLLSKTLGFDIVEWKNPSISEFGMSGYSSIGTQFEEFLGRGDKFGGLDLDNTTNDAVGHQEDQNMSSSEQRVLLVEEFPTILSKSSSSLAAFRLSLKRRLVASFDHGSKAVSRVEPEAQRDSPIIIIVSETLLSSASSVLDNLTVHRLLGPDIYNHPGTTIIDFNAIAPTFMNKALRLVLEKEACQSKRIGIPGPSVLESISEIGDIRSAISSLEFFCLKSNKTGAWGGSLATKTKRSSRHAVSLTSMEKESLKLITPRGASLGMFHAVGKVVYNKREDCMIAAQGTKPPSPPDYLLHRDRPKISQVFVNELVDETGTDIQTFISALHENYVPSCDGSSFTESLDGCIEALSDSDILCLGRKGSYECHAGLGADTLRQDDISYQVAARGLLFALPHPVKRRLTSMGSLPRAGDVHRMFFPTSLRLWCESEKIEGLVDLWFRRLLDPFNASKTDSSFPGSSTQSRSHFQVSNPTEPEDNNKAMAVTMLSRNDLLLHQLPYMARISSNSFDTRELDAITGFRGIGIPGRDFGDDKFDYDDDSSLDSSKAPRDTSLSHMSRRVAKNQGYSSVFGPRLPPPVEDKEGKLILSDDDIEDE